MDEGPDLAAGAGEATEAEIARLAEERARLQAEVDELRAQVAGPGAFDLSWLGLLLLGLVVGSFELVVWRIGEVAASGDALGAGGAVEGS